MSLDDRQELDLAAAEYVLGTLAGEERARLERELASREDLRAAVARWEERLYGLAEAAPPARPSPEVWDRIEHDLAQLAPEAAGEPAALPLPEPATEEPPAIDPRHRRREPLAELHRRLRSWRLIAAAGLAAAVALALYLALDPRPAPVEAPPAMLLAVLQPEAGPVWLVRAESPGAAVVQPLAEPGAAPDQDFELWATPAPDQPPLSLGVIAADRPTVVQLPSPLGDRLGEGMALAISLEPAGGSPTGAPTGPMVYSGELTTVPRP